MQNGDEASPSIISAGQALKDKFMLIKVYFVQSLFTFVF